MRRPTAPRTKTLLDLLRYKTTRKLVRLWVPFWLVIGACAVWYADGPVELALGALYGIFVYSLVEYLMHRFLYHWEPDNKVIRFITADVGRHHMRHHREPSDYKAAINAVQAPVVILSSLLAAVVFVLPEPLKAAWLASVVAGSMNYIAQELIHFGTHHMPMNSGFLAVVKRHHMLHHYRGENANFGLFWTFWDRILGTTYDQVSRREKAAAAKD
ncbi:sterol desaturase family protein [Acuticoccus sp. I52.16.1]|uniref:sterol desaturase family protein n=1 Tax=Acuticoccus sp. I52.16.1 TaxID=2928472 RepID=UPI001FD5A389|nr:sterol desaturase family protein [Acuticoccus sp. I52.16.1]UOM34517.1 sterol desaturase family protein [Acuticoccus sp. I52.16.1]